MDNISLAKILQNFFVKRLINQQNVSPQTVSSYRDTFLLLINYVCKVLKKKPSDLSLENLDAAIILCFLNGNAAMK